MRELSRVDIGFKKISRAMELRVRQQHMHAWLCIFAIDANASVPVATASAPVATASAPVAEASVPAASEISRAMELRERSICNRSCVCAFER
jgi:hypothetical protein